MVADSWAIPQPGKPLVRFHLKLKALKKALQVWNKTVFGNVMQAVYIAEDKMLMAEHDYDTLPSEYNKLALCAAKQDYNA